MPINRRLAREEIAFILRDGQARALFAEREFCERRWAIDAALNLLIPFDALGMGDDYARWRDALPTGGPAGRMRMRMRW
jgi:hypothetical protein